jgi:hypothetical protein
VKFRKPLFGSGLSSMKNVNASKVPLELFLGEEIKEACIQIGNDS